MNTDFTDNIVNKCPYCGYEASIKHFGTWEKDGKRGLLGKTAEGFLMFLCPECENHIKHDPLSNRFFKEEQPDDYYSVYLKARDRLRKIAINYLPLWIISILSIAIWSLFEKDWAKYVMIAIVVLLILRVSIANIKHIRTMYNFHGGHNRPLRNNLLVSFIGLFSTVYIAISVYFSLQYGTIGAVIGFLAAIINGMQGKAYDQNQNEKSPNN